jgi:hypothetical protein
MSTPKPITSNPGAPRNAEPPSSVEKLERDAFLVGAAGAGALRAVDVAAVVLVGLLVVPPLAIVVLLVVGPLLLMALVLGLLAAVLSIPYLLVQHFRGYSDGDGHLSLLGHRVRHAAGALIDLAPHRIVADARKLGHGPRTGA